MFDVTMFDVTMFDSDLAPLQLGANHTRDANKMMRYVPRILSWSVGIYFQGMVSAGS